jgi:hypothetical protein
MRARGLARARQYTWDGAADRIIELLQWSDGRQRIPAMHRAA